MRVAEALALARELGVARLDAQLLLGHHLQRPRSWLIAHDDATLDADAAAAVEADLRRHAMCRAIAADHRQIFILGTGMESQPQAETV